MAGGEKFNPVGEFSINPDECKGLKMCVLLARGTNLKVRKKDKLWEYTEVVSQPKTPEEQTLMLEGLAICPFQAGTIDGNPNHAAFSEHEQVKAANPALVERAFSAVTKARKENRKTNK